MVFSAAFISYLEPHFSPQHIVSCGRVFIVLILFVMSIVSDEGKEGAGDLAKVI